MGCGVVWWGVVAYGGVGGGGWRAVRCGAVQRVGCKGVWCGVVQCGGVGWGLDGWVSGSLCGTARCTTATA